jgi:hypothetical protein
MPTIPQSRVRVAEEPVHRWRLECLLAGGYPRREAELLSERADVDLHLALRLLDAGCPVETAMRILL